MICLRPDIPVLLLPSALERKGQFHCSHIAHLLLFLTTATNYSLWKLEKVAKGDGGFLPFCKSFSS